MKNFKTQTINIESIYAKLKSHISNRSRHQVRQENLWKEIKRTHENKHSEMKKIDELIGNETHEINKLISILCRYNKTHRAMNLASDFINGEISRTIRIINNWKRDIRDVESGRCSFISSTGEHTQDTSIPRKYVAKKEQKLAQLRNWKRHVDRYCV